MVAMKQTSIEPLRRVTAREYLERERSAATKSEYHRGVLVAMAGASPEHNAIVFDMAVSLGLQLRGEPCQGFASDMRVRVPACDKYYYPDIVVVCGEPRYQHLGGIETLLNPTLIVEVLSESTEAADRGDKWICYQTLHSLQTYVLVSQDRVLVEVYQRAERNWIYTTYEDTNQVIALEAILCELRVSEVYARVPIAAAQHEVEPSGVETELEEATK